MGVNNVTKEDGGWVSVMKKDDGCPYYHRGRRRMGGCLHYHKGR